IRCRRRTVIHRSKLLPHILLHPAIHRMGHQPPSLHAHHLPQLRLHRLQPRQDRHRRMPRGQRRVRNRPHQKSERHLHNRPHRRHESRQARQQRAGAASALPATVHRPRLPRASLRRHRRQRHQRRHAALPAKLPPSRGQAEPPPRRRRRVPLLRLGHHAHLPRQRPLHAREPRHLRDRAPDAKGLHRHAARGRGVGAGARARAPARHRRPAAPRPPVRRQRSHLRGAHLGRLLPARPRPLPRHGHARLGRPRRLRRPGPLVPLPARQGRAAGRRHRHRRAGHLFLPLHPRAVLEGREACEVHRRGGAAAVLERRRGAHRGRSAGHGGGQREPDGDAEGGRRGGGAGQWI
ncbi:hypothetical protein LTR39_004742, partial [Cryomyces antarcticus]